MVHCPRCGTANAPSNQLCIACGSALHYGAAPGYPGAAGPMPQQPQPHTPSPYVGQPPPGAYPPAGQPPPQGFGNPVPPPAQPGFAPPNAAPAGFPGAAPGYYTPPGTPQPAARPSQPDRVSAPGTKIVGFLVSFEQNEQGDFWALRAGQLRVGRKDAADGLAVAIDHPTVSSNHALLTLDPDGQIFQIEDLRSANGTVLNGRAIAGQGPREVRDGDRVRFGGFSATLKLLG